MKKAIKKTLVLLFDDFTVDRVLLAPMSAQATLNSGHRRTLSQMLVELAYLVLPRSEWRVVAFSCDVELSTKIDNWKSESPSRQIDLAIADVYFQMDNAQLRDFTKLVRARRALSIIKHHFPKARCVLTASLPEPDPEQLNRGEFPTSPQQPVDRFVPLAHTNVNPWDELFNVLKQEESRIVFRRGRPSKSVDPRKCQLAAHVSQPIRVIEHDIVLDGSRNSNCTPGPSLTEIEWNGCHFKGRVILKKCRLKHLRVRSCRFDGPVLLQQCHLENSSFLAECTFGAHFNMVSCSCDSDVILDRNEFGDAGQNDHGANSHHARGTLDRRLPWFSQCVFEGHFAFRGNRGLRLSKVNRVKGNPKEFRAHTLMFHTCRFNGRVDITVPAEQTKLALYGCAFRAGQHVDISYPYDPDEMRVRAAGDRAQHPSRFDIAGVPGDTMELRLCHCDIAGRLVVREHPWSLDPYMAKQFQRSRSLGPKPMPPLVYEASRGIGVNVHGATLSGSLNLRFLRIKWLNCERMTVLGGALFLNSAALRKPHVPGKWWAMGKLRIVFDVAPEVVRLVFEERYGCAEEESRFTAFFPHSPRLIEHCNPTLGRIEMLRNIVQQYEDLRKAFRNASNSHSHEDYCQYKTMMYAGQLKQLLYADRPARALAIRIVGSVTLACVLVTVIALSFSGATWAERLTAAFYATILGAVGCLTVSGDVRRYFSGRLDWLIYRKLLGYLVYPSRTIASAILTIVLFAFAYAACDTMSAITNNDIFGAVNSASSIRESDQVTHEQSPRMNAPKVDKQDPQGVSGLSGAVSHFGNNLSRMLHFSVITFTTVGYGDETPAGVMRPLSNLEAVVGALFMAMITVALVRHVIRA